MRLADIGNPNLKPWVTHALTRATDELLAEKLRIGARANCLPGEVPQFPLYASGFENLYFIQTPKQVLMTHQADTQVRHVCMDVPHTSHPAASWCMANPSATTREPQLLTEEPCGEIMPGSWPAAFTSRPPQSRNSEA